MPSFGLACKGCIGEDCPCCETFLEWKAEGEAVHDREFGDDPDYGDDDIPSDEWESEYEDDGDE